MIYAPAADEMFWAEKGAGAFINDRRLRVSARRDLSRGGVRHRHSVRHRRRRASGWPSPARSALLMPQIAGIRRFGSAALDLAWVAAGRFDGYWELGIKPWDIAAGRCWCARPAAM